MPVNWEDGYKILIESWCMLVSDKEQKIKEKILEITGINIDINQQATYDYAKNFRGYKIKKILLISFSFNYFKLEKEGRLTNLFSEYLSFNVSEGYPEIIHVESEKEYLNILKSDHFDLILIFIKPDDKDITKDNVQI